MADTGGRIELRRRVDSITIGVRHRTDQGELEPLMRSIQRIGMLQPVTITSDGILVCGYRRLEAVKRLGWRTLTVWVQAGVSDRLTSLLAQQDENLLHKPLSPTEAAKLYTELKLMLAEDAARRQEATRFGSDHDPGPTAGEGTGGPDSGPPSTGQGKASRQAARMVNGNASHTRLEQVSFLQQVATDGDQVPVVRKLAEVLLEEVGNGHPVDPAYRRVKAAVELVEGGHSDNSTGEPSPEQVEQLSEQAAERVQQNRARRATRARPKPDPGKQARSSMRSFVLTWQDLDGWTDNYDPADLGPALTSEQWAMVERVFTQTAAFIEAARTARASQQSDSAPADGVQAAQRAA